MTETISYVTIRTEPLKAVVRAIVTAAGSSAREADLVADHLVEANLPATTPTASAWCRAISRCSLAGT